MRNSFEKTQKKKYQKPQIEVVLFKMQNALLIEGSSMGMEITPRSSP
jgi:hypothetical protein